MSIRRIMKSLLRRFKWGSALGESSTAGMDRPLVAPRPRKMAASSYHLVHDDKAVEEWFFKLRDELFAVLDEMRRKKGRPVAVRESGWLDSTRPYFYIKPMSSEGLLFERQSTGWVVSHAEKIVGESTFIRKPELWDRVALYVPNDRGVNVQPRVASEKLANERMHFSIYEEKLLPFLVL